MGLPFFPFVVVYYLNPSYVMLLFDDPMGRQSSQSPSSCSSSGTVHSKNRQHQGGYRDAVAIAFTFADLYPFAVFGLCPTGLVVTNRWRQ